MVDPITLVVAALTAGTVAAVKEGATDAVKTAFQALRGAIAAKYPTASVSQLEAAPLSPGRQAVVVEDLAAAGARDDEQLFETAMLLLAALRDDDPEAARVVGVDVRDFRGESLRISDVAARGAAAVGVHLENMVVFGPVEISGVQAEEGDTPKKH